MNNIFKCGRYDFDLSKKPYIMGILNVTPDSFSDGGTHLLLDDAMMHVKRMIDEGVDIIDVGGESTRPGHIKISDEEEIYRTSEVVEKIRANYDIPISLDTYKPKVFKAVAEIGIDMINDIWGFKWHEDMAKIAAEYNVGCCLMHNRDNRDYNNLENDVIADLKESVDIAKKAGIADDRIMLDPGIGFAKDTDENLITMDILDKICEIGYPVLIGTSRKSMIGNTLNLPVDQREEGTIATSVFGLMKGCTVFRVHDVQANKRALDMTFAMMNARR